MRPLKNNQETTPPQQQNHTLAWAGSAAAIPVHAGRRGTTDIPWLEGEIGFGDELAGLGLLQRSGGGGLAQWTAGPPRRALLNGAAHVYPTARTPEEHKVWTWRCVLQKTFIKGSTDHATNMEHQVLSLGEVKAMEKQFLEMESSIISPASIKSTSIMKVLALIKDREDQFGPRARALYLNWKSKGKDSRGSRQVLGQAAKVEFLD
ncbi:hypothetical protein B0H13DRAFT_2552874 [Mycena leptocephala]|nr:hypothetical protein B0H13DRAFT_2552874 [Mycena leptocephala]